MSLSTHVLDTDSGQPVSGLRVQVQRVGYDEVTEVTEVTEVASAVTDDDGRVRELLGAEWGPGRWRVVFDVAGVRADAFFPVITVEVQVPDTSHYHAAVLLGRYAYTTYRGS